MLDVQQKSTGTGYTATAALLTVAFIFVPAFLILSRPFGYLSLSLAIGCSALSATLALILWRKTSQRSILTIVTQKDRRAKTKSALLAIVLLGAALDAPTVHAADFSTYRGMQFGMSLSSASKQAGTSPSEARTVYQRPALIQETDYRYGSLSAAFTQADPLRDAECWFFNGELFRIVVTYDPMKTEGMSAEDMIEGISAIYGSATKPSIEIAYHSIYGEMAPVLARWEDTQYAYNLVRSGDQSSFTLILYSKRPDELAQKAIKEATQLDVLEAPQREVEQQRKREDEQRLTLEKARSTNKANFRP